MKIKVTGTWGNIANGEIVEAIISYDKYQASFYDKDSVTIHTVYKGLFSIIEESEAHNLIGNIRDILGQDIKCIEFK